MNRSKIYLIAVGYLIMVLLVVFHPWLFPPAAAPGGSLGNIGEAVGRGINEHLDRLALNYLPPLLGVVVGLIGTWKSRAPRLRQAFLIGLSVSVVVFVLTLIIRGT